MFELKPIDAEAVPRALEKAERYRLLNEPDEAESICLDILALEPENQPALVMLLLALTDQFRQHDLANYYAQANALLPRLQDEYERCYYAGVIRERRGNAHLERSAAGSGALAYDWLRQAMDWYEKAEAIRPPENDDAILRWNTCARCIARHHLQPSHAEPFEPMLQE